MAHKSSENQEIGVEEEHLLIGSVRWIETEELRAAREGKGFSLNGAISREMRRADGREPERMTGRGETDTGKQVHPDLINHAELTQAMERLHRHSESQHRRYCMFELDGMAVAEIAEKENEIADVIERSLYRARRFLRDLIAEPVM